MFCGLCVGMFNILNKFTKIITVTFLCIQEDEDYVVDDEGKVISPCLSCFFISYWSHV
jgi:hypothetical protein